MASEPSMVSVIRTHVLSPLLHPLTYLRTQHALLPRRRPRRAPSTWLDSPRWTFWHFVASFGVGPAAIYRPEPKDGERREAGRVPMWRISGPTWTFSTVPIVLQQYWTRAHPAVEPAAAFAIYNTWFLIVGFATIRIAHLHMVKYGTLNSHRRTRDIASNSNAGRVGLSIVAFMSVRVLGMFLLAWDPQTVPVISWMSWPKVAMFLIIMDYYYYCAHRATHQVDVLWFLHKRHHSVLAPTPMLVAVGDDLEEIFDITVCPLLACMTIKLDFAEVYIGCLAMFIVEVFDEFRPLRREGDLELTLEMPARHSGVKATMPHPILGPFLGPFGLDLAIEDHDIHHRYGRASGNFGKQTRLWDTVFGTTMSRPETGDPEPWFFSRRGGRSKSQPPHQHRDQDGGDEGYDSEEDGSATEVEDNLGESDSGYSEGTRK